MLRCGRPSHYPATPPIETNEKSLKLSRHLYAMNNPLMEARGSLVEIQRKMKNKNGTEPARIQAGQAPC
jgi:hypothetical protein